MITDGVNDSGGGSGEPRLTGAYETWTYGRGSAYAALAVPLAEARFVPAVMTLPPGAAPEDLADQPTDGETGRVLLPVLWKGLARRAQTAVPWPVLLDFGEPQRRGPLDAGIVNRQLAILTGPILASTNRTQPNFALNAPLVTGTVSPAVRGSTAIAPDPRVLAKVNRTGARLTVMAVIDDGIPFAHRNLLNEAGDSTRVEFCWLQSATTNGNLLFGKEFTRTDIDALRTTHGPDEDAIYHQAGALEETDGASATLGHFASHGAHVLDAAAGWRNDGADLDPLRVIAVQLPPSVTIDTAGYRKDGAVLAALHYIFARADEVALAYLGDADANLPLVINFSYGFSGGPHDGSDPLEVAIAQMVAARKAQNKPTTLVMPAGNSWADAMLGQIAPSELVVGRPFHVPWRLQPNDATSSYLEIWAPATGAPGTYSLALADPQGRAVATGANLVFTTGPGGAPVKADLSMSGAVVGQVDIAPFNAAWTRARIALAATEPRDPTLPAAPSGQWSVSLTRTGGAAPTGPVSCRIQRDNDPYGYVRGGKQSYFDVPDDERHTPDGAPTRIENPPRTFVRRFGSVNGLATHDQVTVVSSHYADTGRATEYASAGPLSPVPGAPGAVSVSMPADASTALRGSLAAGTRSGSAIRLSGTSMAAPLYARRVALAHLDSAIPLPQVQPLKAPVSQAEDAERPLRLGQALAG